MSTRTPLTPAALGNVQRKIRLMNAATERAYACHNRRRKLCHGRQAYRIFDKIRHRVVMVPFASLTVEAPSKGEPSYE